MPLLSIDIEARFAKFQDALNAIERNTQKSAGNMNLAFTALKSTLAGLASALTVGALVAVVKNAIDAADNLNDLSKKTGIAVDTLGGLGFAAKQAGGDLESVVGAADKLNKSIAGAAAGNQEFVAAYAAMGISVRDASGEIKKADVIMAEIADKFASYADGPNKVALAQKTMGKAGAEQISLLNEGGKALLANIEYYKRFAGVTQEVAGKADQFNDTMAKLSLITGAFGRTVAAELLTPLNALSEALLNAKEKSGGMQQTAERLAHALVLLGKASVIGGFGVLDMIDRVTAGQDKIVAWAHFDFEGARKIQETLNETRKVSKEARAELLGALDTKPPKAKPGSRFDEDYYRSKPKAKPDAPSVPGGGAGAGAGAADDPAKKILEGQIKALERLSEQEQRILSSRNEFLQTYYQQDLIAINDYYDARRNAQTEALHAQEANIEKELAILKAFKPKDARAAADRDNKVEALKDKKAALQTAAGLESIKSFAEQDRAAKDFENTLQGINAQLLEQQGLLPQAAAIHFDLANEPITKRITAEKQSALDHGDTATAAARDADLSRLGALRSMAISKAQINSLDEVGAHIQSDLSIATDRAQISAQVGATTELESLRKVSDARLQAAADLKQVADAYDVVAKSSGDPRMIQQAKAMQVEVEKLAASADLVRDKFKDVFSSGFESFFDKLSSGTATVKDAFKAMFSDIGAQLSKIASKNIAEQLFGKQGSLGGIVDTVSSIFGGKSKSPVASADVAGSIAKITGGAADTAASTATTTALTALATSTTAADAAFTTLVATVPATDASLAAMGVSTIAADAALAALTASAGIASAALAAVAASGGGQVASSGAYAAFDWLASANGNLFSAGNVIPFARGGIPSIVNSPTLFPMANGGTGLMGEAGPEAIMPLKRDKGGELAVTMVGERGKVTLLPVTRDGSGRMAVKAFAAGAVFGGTMPIRRFATGAVVMRDANAFAAQNDPHMIQVAQGGHQTVNHITTNVPQGTSAATAQQIAAQTALALARNNRRNN